MSYHDNQLTSSAPNGRVKRASPQRLYILPIFCTHGAHHRMLLCIQSFKWFIDPLRKGKNLNILPKTEDFRLYVWYDFEYEFFNLFYTGGVRHSHIPSCQNIEVFNHCTTIIILQTVMFLMNSVLPSWRKRRSIQCAFCIVLDSCNQCSLKHEILPVPPWTFSHIFPCEIRF